MSLAHKLNASAQEARVKRESAQQPRQVELVCPLTGDLRAYSPSALVCHGMHALHRGVASRTGSANPALARVSAEVSVSVFVCRGYLLLSSSNLLMLLYFARLFQLGRTRDARDYETLNQIGEGTYGVVCMWRLRSLHVVLLVGCLARIM